MTETRFVAQVAGFSVQVDHVRLTLRMTEDQLGRVIHLAAFTGAGTPRPFAIRIAAKEKAGLAWNGWLRNLNIDQYGYSKAVLMLELGFEMQVLAALIDTNVAVEVKDAGQIEGGGKAE